MKRKHSQKIISFVESRKNIVFISLIIFSLVVFVVAEILRDRGKVTSIDFSSELESRMKIMVSGSPIEEMVPYIAKQDKIVAAFLVAIAKKESNWGKYAPEKNGKTCYNFWGYRGTYNQTDSGYSCFDSPSQAVDVVGGRIREFVGRKIDTPKKMAIAWKCGFDCSGHSFFSVKKWEWDVGYYFKKIYE